MRRTLVEQLEGAVTRGSVRSITVAQTQRVQSGFIFRAARKRRADRARDASRFRVNDPYGANRNEAFRILSGYIFGKNMGERKFAMTAPVTQAPAPTRLEMTSPVTQAAAPGGYIVQFVLPKEVTLESAPEPLDARVQLREVPTRRVAAIRYSGFWSESNYTKHLVQLKTVLDEAKLIWTGEPVYSRYNPPWTPWFLRRNEIWLTLT